MALNLSVLLYYVSDLYRKMLLAILWNIHAHINEALVTYEIVFICYLSTLSEVGHAIATRRESFQNTIL